MKKNHYFLLTLLLATTATPQIAHARIGRTISIVSVFGTATLAWFHFLRLQQELPHLDTNTKTKLALLSSAKTLCQTTESLSRTGVEIINELGDNIFTNANNEHVKKLEEAQDKFEKEAPKEPMVASAKKLDELTGDNTTEITKTTNDTDAQTSKEQPK